MTKWRLLAGVAAGAAVLAFTTLPSAATVADDLCAPVDDPCTVSSTVVVDASSVLDFGARALVLTDEAKLTWSGDLTITAGSCSFSAKSKVIEDRDSSGTDYLSLNCGSSDLAGQITTVGAGVIVEGDGPHTFSGKLKAKGDQVGVIAIDSFGLPGDITVTGKINAQSKLGTPPGEFRLWTYFGNIVLGEKGKIDTKAFDSDPFSEYFFFLAESGTVTVDGKINTKSKTGAYALNFEGDGDVTFGPKSKVQAKSKVTGAEVAINSQGGDVLLQGKIQAQVKEVSDGARVHICASHDIVVDGGAQIDDSDKGFDSSIIIGAGNHARVGNIDKGAKLYAKTDGDIEICGNTTGAFVYSKSKVVPDPEAKGNGICLSPTSQVTFWLDCNQ